MKYIILITIGFIALGNTVFAQCPQRGLQILTADCEPPKNLLVNVVSCSSLDVKWKGNKSQTYVLKASYPDAPDNIVEIDSAKYSCDSNGNCTGSFAVKENTMVSWSVQGVCSTGGVITYSPKVPGQDAFIPYCSEKRNDPVKENAIHVYPNPATNYLIVEFDAKSTAPIEFKVFDITGKNVYDKLGDGVIKNNNQYKLDLRSLSPGTYMLELHNDNEVNQTKFVLMRN